MPPTQARDRAMQLATADAKAALAAATKINDPWCGCQALAGVARFAPDDHFKVIIDKAFEVGRRAEDLYQVVASAAWPLRALVERNHADRLPTSRCEALLLVYQAVFPAGRKWWLTVLRNLAGCADPAGHWRVGRAIRDAVLIAGSDDLEFARDFVRGIGSAKVRGQIERGLARGEVMLPRGFF